MPEREAAQQVIEAVAYAAREHTKWFWKGVYGGKPNFEAGSIRRIAYRPRPVTPATKRANMPTSDQMAAQAAMFSKSDKEMVDLAENERRDQERLKRRVSEDALADEAAVWTLADIHMPPDIEEYGRRHKMPELAHYLWRSAFVQGWRAAIRAKPLSR
jgi:hypothetical protein